jgi:hypothetical protein
MRVVDERHEGVLAETLTGHRHGVGMLPCARTVFTGRSRRGKIELNFPQKRIDTLFLPKTVFAYVNVRSKNGRGSKS